MGTDQNIYRLRNMAVILLLLLYLSSVQCMIAKHDEIADIRVTLDDLNEKFAIFANKFEGIYHHLTVLTSLDVKSMKDDIVEIKKLVASEQPNQTNKWMEEHFYNVNKGLNMIDESRKKFCTREESSLDEVKAT